MSLEQGLRPILDRLQKFKEGDKEKRFNGVNELINLFSKDQEFANNILKNTFSLWNEYHINPDEKTPKITAEKRASDLLRIKNFYNTPGYERSEKRIKLLLDQEKEPEYHSFSKSPDDPNRTEEELPIELKKHFQNVLIAYTFVSNKSLYEQRRERENYDKPKEERQIDAVLSALEGNHIHMGTGEGKSLTVITIASIIESITSSQKDCFVASISETLLEKMKLQTEKLLEKLRHDSHLSEFDLQLMSVEEPEQIESAKDTLFNDMQKEALLSDDINYSPEIKKQILQQCWEKKLNGNTEKEDILKKEFGGPRIVFTTERELVFKLAENPIKFAKTSPKIFMDEADVAYNRKSPYVQDMGDGFASKKDIRFSAVNWLFSYILSHQIKESDFQYENGSYKLIPDLENSDRFQLDNKLLKEGISIIGKKIGLDGEQEKLFAEKARKLIENSFQNEHERIEEIQRTGHVIGGIYNTLGKQCIFDEQGELQLRDNYTDELLENHEYQPDVHMAILALNDKFEFVQMNKINHSSIKFPTFVHYLKDKLICFSGTLKYPDPKTKKIKDSNFSKFLEAATKRKVRTIINPLELKTVPNPDLYKTEEEAIIKLKDDLKVTTKPTLVIDYEGTLHTKKLFNIIRDSRTSGKDRIVLLPPKPTKKKEESAYNDLVDEMTIKLANGEIDILISSGTAGTGINIINDDGSFPDLSVKLFGMPENEMQPTQGVGRRRMIGDDSAWFLSLDQMERDISNFKEKKATKLDIKLGEIDQQKIRELLGQALTNPKKRLDVILELLKQKRRQEGDDDKLSVEYDIFYQSFRKMFEKKIYKKIRSDFPNKILRKDAFRLMGMPENLYFEMPQIFNFNTNENSSTDYINRLKRSIFVQRPGREEKNYFDEQVDFWYDLNVNKVREYAELVRFQGKVDSKTSYFGAKIHLVPFEKKQFFQLLYPIAIFPPFDEYIPVIINSTSLGLEKGDNIYYITDQNGAVCTTENYSALSILPLANNQLAIFCRNK